MSNVNSNVDINPDPNYVAKTQQDAQEILSLLDNVYFNERIKVPVNPVAFLTGHTVSPSSKQISVNMLSEKDGPSSTMALKPGTKFPPSKPTYELRTPALETSLFPILHCEVQVAHRGKLHFTSKVLTMADGCSSCHYITEKCLKQIPSHMYKDLGYQNLNIDTLTGRAQIRCNLVEIQFQIGTSGWYTTTFKVVKKIMTTPLACLELRDKLVPLKFSHRQLHSKLGPLSHGGYVPGKDIGILLGTKFATKFLGQPLENLYKDFPEIIVYKTPGGNVLSGSLEFQCNCTDHGMTHISKEVTQFETAVRGETNTSHTLLAHDNTCDTNMASLAISTNMASQTDTVQNNTFMANAAHLEHQIQELFRVEHLDRHSALDSDVKGEDHVFFKTISESCVFDKKEKCYRVKLPFLAETEPVLYNNFTSAKLRFESMERRLAKALKEKTINQSAIDKINQSLLEHIESGKYVEITDQTNLSNPNEICNYLPIRLVFNPKSLSTPIRATLDASANSGNAEKGYGPSLNSCLATGMNTLPPQESCHLNFRKRKYGFGLDLSRFFLSILVEKDHRKYQRFVFKPIGSQQKLKAYEIRTVCWGQSPSPQICSLVLKKHCGFLLEDPDLPYSFKQAIESICDGKSVYADNILQSCHTIKEAQQRIAHLETLFKKGGFITGKYVATHPEILKFLPKEKKSEENLVLFTSGNGYETYMTGNTRLLGEMFNFKTDQYEMGGFDQLFEKYREIMSITKTDLASAMAQVAFSHLGFRAPYTLLAKALLQQVCLAESQEIEKLGPCEARPTVSQLWKRPLPPEFLNDFKQWIAYLPELNDLYLDRYLPTFDDPFPFKIVLFSDAGSFSCCAVAYMVSYDPAKKKVVSNFIKCNIKSKPLSLERMNTKKPYTVPRLELMGLHLANELAIKLCEDLGVVPAERCLIYGDSMVANAWAKSDLEKLSVWHSNKVRPLQKSNIPIGYIYTQLNPADCGTKMVKVSRLKEDLWKHGPDFLEWDPRTKKWPTFSPDRAVDRKAAGFLDGLKRNAVELNFFLNSHEYGITKAQEMSYEPSLEEKRGLTCVNREREFSLATYAENRLASQHASSAVCAASSGKPQTKTSKQKLFKNLAEDPAAFTTAKTTFAIWEALMIENSNHLRQKMKLAHILRFVQNCKIKVQIAKWKKKNKTTAEPTEAQVPRFSYTQAVKEAELLIFHWHQAKCFPEELATLVKQEQLNIPEIKTRVDKKSRIFPLNPKLHREGRGNYPIIRSRGRLQYGRKEFPVILDPGILDTKKVHEDSLAQKMVKDLGRGLHLTNSHANSRELVQLLRKANIHVLRLKQFCLYTYRFCGKCALHHTQPIAELMAPLPQELSGQWTNEHGQLEVMKHLMIDHMGPFKVGGANPFQRKVTRSSNIIKVHVLLVLDLVSGFLTTWIVPSVNAYYTAMALKCHFNNFIQASTIACDNASAFKLIDNELSKYYADAKNQEALEREMADLNPLIKFKFGAPASPHMQGAVERSVRSLKRALKLVHQKELFSYHTLQLSLSDVCGIFNSRPLGILREMSHRDEIHDLLLTPKGILFAETSNPQDDNFYDALEGVTKRSGLLNNAWKFRKHMAQQFSSKFINDFLPEKDARTKWQGPEPKDIKVGSVVVFEKEVTPSDRETIKSLGGSYKPSPATWPIALVKRKIMSKDGICRAYQLQLTDSIYKYEKGNMKNTFQVIKKPTVLTRSANRCRLVPVYDRYTDLRCQVDSFPFGQDNLAVNHHPMRTRSKAQTLQAQESSKKTFMGLANEMTKEKKLKFQQQQDQEDFSFFWPFLFPFSNWKQ